MGEHGIRNNGMWMEMKKMEDGIKLFVVRTSLSESILSFVICILCFYVLDLFFFFFFGENLFIYVLNLMLIVFSN